MRIALVTPYYAPAYRGGGPIRTAVAMVAEHGARHEFLVLTGDTDWGCSQALPVPTARWVEVGAARVWYAHASSPRSLRAGLAQVRRAHPDVLYLNSVLHPQFSILPLTLARLGYFGRARVLLAPRGELGEGALRLKQGKKAAFLALARAVGLHRRVTWHASSPREAAEIDAVFPGARVVIRENEVLLPERAVPPPAMPTGATSAGAAGDAGVTDQPLRLVFVSRLAPKKGLHVVLAALAQVREAVHLVVVGEGEPTYTHHCHALAAQLPGHISVEFVGAVPGERVGEYFAAADLFAFPTAHENFGHAVAESLAASCPVLIADVTPWTPVVGAGGGEIVRTLEAAAWAAAIERWAGADAGQRRQRRVTAGRAYDAWRAIRPQDSVFDLAYPDG
ncbi:MAG: glycosyltransferase [Austwickia sp.]|nr:glycosyltransferase [Austwickia sp.]